MQREHLDLTGLWRFQPDVMKEGEGARWFEPEYGCMRWREVRLPCAFDRCGPGMSAYEGAAWFRRTIHVPAEWAGRRVICRFHGVNYHSRVWLNGELVGGDEDGFLPFEFQVAGQLHFGEDNLLAVRVDNERRQGEVPGRERGWRPFGGILRPVEMVATDPVHLARLQIVAEPDGGAGRLALRAEIANAGHATQDACLHVRISDSDGDSVHAADTQPVTVPVGGRQEVMLRTEVDHVRPWSPGEPSLYTATCLVRAGEEERDRREVRFGFRTVEASGERLMLNGEPVFLTGFNRHEDSPQTDMASDPEAVRRDLRRMKRMGCNFVRLCHYPHDPGELDLCDEIGLLAMCEIPLYWWSGLEEGEENCTRKLAAAKRQLTRMIHRDINHPSVIFWSVSNETQEKRPEVAEGNRELIRLARELDPTRLAVHVSMHWQEITPFEEDDVVCVNAYPTWFGRQGSEVGVTVERAEQTWRSALGELHEACPDKPILVTEFGHPSLEGVFGCAIGEDMQARSLEAQFAGMDAPYVCGAAIWCYADHPWPEEPFVRRLTRSPFGVVSRERRSLQAADAVSRMFRERQGIPAGGEGGPQQRPSGGWPVNMVRPHMRDIPEVPFPDGFSMRPMRRDEVGLWTDIQRDAEPFIDDIDAGLFMQEFGDDLEAIRWRCFLLTDAEGVAIGTISAWYSREFRGQDYGRIHWFAIRPGHQGRGLGRAALSYAMQRLAEWHERAWLATSTGRLAAIKLYLDFGFAPDLEPDGARDAWREVATYLDHPGLAGIEEI